MNLKGVFPRLAAGGAVLALLGVSAIPVSAVAIGPSLDVSNPSAGSYMRRGKHMFTGVACDKNAKSGSGISSVTVFLGDRDAANGVAFYAPGGYVGSATLGLPATGGPCAGVSGAGWKLKTISLKKGKYTLFVYARSSVTGGETVTQIPIRVDKP